jgi:hypothetical protein
MNSNIKNKNKNQQEFLCMKANHIRLKIMNYKINADPNEGILIISKI